MNTWFVLACLCACAFAGWLNNHPLPCPYHVKVESTYSLTGAVEVYAVEDSNGFPLFMKVVREDGFYGILRCDEKNDEGKCLQHTYNPSQTSNPCSDSYISHENALIPFYVSEFGYDDSRYPQNTTCADGSSCKLYCTDDDSECVVVNAEGYFVMVNDMNYTIYESPAMDVFELDKCDASDPHRHLDAPANACGKFGVLYPPPIGCKYHIKVTEYYNPLIRDVVTEFYGLVLDRVPLYAKVISGSETTLIRCDITDENGKCYHVLDDQGKCYEGYVSGSDVANRFTPQLLKYPVLYDSVNYPKLVKCPDNSTGCKLYCTDISESACWTIDPAGNIVVDQYGNIYTYFDPPSLDEFDGSDCESESLPTSVDYCPMVGTISPKLPECSFHMHSVGGLPIRRDNTLKSARSDDDIIDYYYIIVDGEVVAVKILFGDSYSDLYRFDMLYSGDVCYSQFYEKGVCSEGYLPASLKLEFSRYFLPQPIQYNISEYPVDIKCPNETDGCKLYCGEYCVVVDDNGYFVRTDYLGNLTYDTDFSFDFFGTVKCDGVIPVPAPSTDVCASSSSITPSSTTSTHSTSSTTPTSQTSQPSINPSLSSASVTKAIISVVAIAVAVALL